VSRKLVTSGVKKVRGDTGFFGGGPTGSRKTALLALLEDENAASPKFFHESAHIENVGEVGIARH